MGGTFQVIREAMPQLLQGLSITLEISVIGLLLGGILGILFGLMRSSNNAVLKGIATVYVELIRGTPMMVQAIWLYFALPQIVGFYFSTLQASIIAITINAGAYIAEIVRSGVQSIDKGQVEAARSLGLTGGQTMRYVVLPQAFRRIIPPLVNQFAISLKDTSILSVIGAGEVMRVGQIIVANNFKALQIYSTVAILYLIIVEIISIISQRLERRMRVD
ncbi:MAG: amino acid ABC transporter permease [Firmicutes bacterium]|nr:amino acid ABC transporter permease [Bacillota bacterium]